MNNGELLYERLKELKAEVRNLKTAHFKTATTISTTTRTVTVNFSLMLERLSGNVFSTKRAVISMTTEDNTEMVSACYLAGMNPGNINGRFIEILRMQPQAGVIRFGVAVTTGNQSDWETLSQGGTVNLSYDIQLVGSSRFQTSVEYQNIEGVTP